MSTNSETRLYSRYQRLITHLRTPLYRNGYFLVLGSLLTSGIGLIYWILVANKYPTYTVGINTAIISAMTFLAGISQINLMSALIRFIPTAGRSTKRFVLYAYLVSLVASAVTSYIFIKNLGRWSPALKFLGDDPALALWFILSTMAWCIFVLQDSVLTGLRQASWVPLENTVFSLTKIAIVLILAVSLPSLGIFASWSFALIVAVLPTNYFIFRRLIPQHMQQAEQANGNIETRQVIRYVAADYVGMLFWIISTTLMPVIVTNVAGATANAYYYLSFTIAHTVFLISPNMGSSLVVETANNPHKLGVYSYRIFKNITKFVVPSAVFIALTAPYILMIFGKGYSAEGATLLRLLALTAIPYSVNSVFLSISRVQRRMTNILVTLGVSCVLLLGLSYSLLKVMGITGVGIGWLVSQSLVAAVIYLTQLRNLWNSNGEERPGANMTLVGDKHNNDLMNFLYQVASKLKLVPFLLRVKKRWSKRRREARLVKLMPGLMAALSEHEVNPQKEPWTIQYVANNETNNIVAFLGPSNGAPGIVLKLPGNAKEVESLKRQEENLVSLNGDERLGEWLKLLPVVVSKGSVDGQAYYAEQVSPGRTLLSVMRSRGINPGIISLAAGEIGLLHQRTAALVDVDMDILESWVNEPLRQLTHLASSVSGLQRYQAAIDRLETELNVALANRRLCASWIHGDYSLSNVLIDAQGSRVTGIVDWDLAKPNYLPLIDVMHLLLSMRMESERRELGQIVRDLLLYEHWKPEELAVLHQAECELPADTVEPRVALLLSWLHHIHANLSKTSRYDRNSIWVSENIVSVLKVL